ncbi:TIGR02391 family protein [Gracilimonas amylolytica]|uniref:TIGR02391 family protein n=1 Tax=Gracilimonas amylolytica TaxID=1749045 RepID=UPI000CD9ED0B|nr:TIGR02391 family protein [Gracilimonas amylolytica]
MAREKELLMSFDPHTIEHLGVKMYSNLPNALAELIANAYDADAKTVFINLYENEENKRIQITDDGVGMSFEDLNEKFLRIGRKRREEGDKFSPSGERKVTGRKGLGKLAFFGLADIIDIETIKAGTGSKVNFTLSWHDLLNTNGTDYKPNFKEEKTHVDNQGTEIILQDLKRKSPFNKEDLAISLSKLFNLFDKNFRVFLSLNDDEPIQINEKLKFKNIESQFEWIFPEFSKNVDYEYEYSDHINGKILSTEKPLKPGLRGITLFANGRLVNAPEFFGVSESSHGFSYFTGWLDVDYVDDWDEDVISTDRQSLSWDLPKTEELKEYLKKTMSELERKWREKRKEVRRVNIQKKSKINIVEWFDKLPADVRSKIEPVILKLEDSELQDSDQSDVVTAFHDIAPEYPYFHWRHLHPEIQKVSKKHYEDEYYYAAFIEGLKRYVSAVKKKARKTNLDERNLMQAAFNGLLKVTQGYKRSDGTNFEQRTINNIEEAQKILSEGIVVGGRHPLQHEEHLELKESGLFTEKDCLDALSLLSHLYRRLDVAILIQ